MDPARRYRQALEELGLELGPVPEPRGRYLPALAHGDQLWLSGVTGRRAAQPALRGVVGEEVTLEQARASSRQAAANLVAAVLSVPLEGRVVGLQFLRGYVRASDGFEDHPVVIDAASEVLEHVLGGRGHARAAIGVASLPGGACVELEAVVQLGEGAADAPADGLRQSRISD